MLLHTAPLDLSSADLGVRLNGPKPPCILAEKVATTPQQEMRVRLGIIGGSHVATVENGEGHALLREELSCHAVETGTRLQQGVELTKEEGGLGYSFAALPMELATSQFEALVTFLQERGAEAASTGSWLVGEFPGEERGHITALVVIREHDWQHEREDGDHPHERELHGRHSVGTPSALCWRTWHLYPRERVAVFSESVFTRGTRHQRIDLELLRNRISQEVQRDRTQPTYIFEPERTLQPWGGR